MSADSKSFKSSSKIFDVIIIGGGAAGIFAAIFAAQRGRSVLLLEKNKILGRKILVSGGGRCNFTNLKIGSENYLSSNKHFAKSALYQYTNDDFIELVKEHNIKFYEKKLGQLFCVNRSDEILGMLQGLLDRYNVCVKTRIETKSILKNEKFEVEDINNIKFLSKSLVLSTGGPSFPQLGASDFGQVIAKRFGHKIIPLTPALVPFVLKDNLFVSLSGISHDVVVTCKKVSFEDSLLFTHKGLSGPVILKISLYWEPGDEITIDFLPLIKDINYDEFEKYKLKLFFEDNMSKNMVLFFAKYFNFNLNARVMELGKRKFNDLIFSLKNFKLTPDSTEGLKKAEVVKGGVDVNMINSKTMESKIVPNLFFAGEILDVTGWLGGYNFQWAWSSGYVAGNNV